MILVLTDFKRNFILVQIEVFIEEAYRYTVNILSDKSRKRKSSYFTKIPWFNRYIAKRGILCIVDFNVTNHTDTITHI